MRKSKTSRSRFIIATLIVIVLAVLLLISWFGFAGNEKEIDNTGKINEVCVNDKCFNVEAVQTSEERARGLMFRESLDRGSGMFFVFDESGEYRFWMKNTLIPLDIIWINTDFKIIHIANALPCEKEPCEQYGPDSEALYVLEINGGLAEEFGIGIGDDVKLNL